MMGWGTKRAPAPRPEPESAKEIKAFAAAISETVPEPKSEDTKAQLEWHRLKSQKGWTEATVAMLLYEFVQQQGAFSALVKFVRKR